MERAHHHGMDYDQKTTGMCYVCVRVTDGTGGGGKTGMHWR